MNWAEFFRMGGYAFYVWGSYLVAAVVIGGEVLFLLQRRKQCADRARQELTNETSS
ncbi:MAG: heme exporter protein CcmD [bacterium]